jgi:hypothetical protein
LVIAGRENFWRNLPTEPSGSIWNIEGDVFGERPSYQEIDPDTFPYRPGCLPVDREDPSFLHPLTPNRGNYGERKRFLESTLQLFHFLLEFPALGFQQSLLSGKLSIQSEALEQGSPSLNLFY